MAIFDDGRNNIAIVGEPVGSDQVLKTAPLGKRIVVRGFQCTANQIGGSSSQLHFGILGLSDVRWSSTSVFNVPNGLGDCEMVGPKRESVGPTPPDLYMSVNKLTGDPDGTWNGWVKYELEDA